MLAKKLSISFRPGFSDNDAGLLGPIGVHFRVVFRPFRAETVATPDENSAGRKRTLTTLKHPGPVSGCTPWPASYQLELEDFHLTFSISISWYKRWWTLERREPSSPKRFEMEPVVCVAAFLVFGTVE